MLRIQSSQQAAFDEIALLDFEDEMVEHIEDYAPMNSKLLGNSGVRKVIRLGFDRAEGYGLTSYGSVQFYIELMFMFGSDFDTDPLLPWAMQALRDPAPSDEMARAMELYDGAMDYIERVVGQDRKPAIEAFRRLCAFDYEPPLRRGESDFEARALSMMAQTLPEQYAYLGEEPLRALIRRAPGIAAQIGLVTDRGVVLTILFSCMMGKGFASDPMFPWIEATLSNPSLETPEKMVGHLEQRARKYFEHALRHLEREHVDG
jgi:hypothetical protein